MGKIIGIVGGVGTFAGIDLYRKIYNHTDARTDIIDFLLDKNN